MHPLDTAFLITLHIIPIRRSNPIFYSFDEMAKYDLPATVDKILSVTGAKQLFYASHSQGGEIALAQLSQDPAFAAKIKLFVGLAPAAYIGDAKSPVALLAPYAKDLEV